MYRRRSRRRGMPTLIDLFSRRVFFSPPAPPPLLPLYRTGGFFLCLTKRPGLQRNGPLLVSPFIPLSGWRNVCLACGAEGAPLGGFKKSSDLQSCGLSPLLFVPPPPSWSTKKFFNFFFESASSSERGEGLQSSSRRSSFFFSSVEQSLREHQIPHPPSPLTTPSPLFSLGAVSFGPRRRRSDSATQFFSETGPSFCRV